MAFGPAHPIFDLMSQSVKSVQESLVAVHQHWMLQAQSHSQHEHCGAK